MNVKLTRKETRKVEIDNPTYFKVENEASLKMFRVYENENGQPCFDKISYWPVIHQFHFASGLTHDLPEVLEEGTIIEAQEYIDFLHRFYGFVSDKIDQAIAGEPIETEEDEDLLEAELLEIENHAANRADDLNDDRKLREAV